MRNGARIGLDRTAVPVELDRISSSLDDLLVALGPQGANKDGALADALATGAANLDGQGKALHDTTRDLSLGALVYCIGTMLRPGAAADYPEQVILAILRALGLPETEATTFAYAPLPDTQPPQGVIFERIAANPPAAD